jgi:S1-C subfamily serine protease
MLSRIICRQLIAFVVYLLLFDTFAICASLDYKAGIMPSSDSLGMAEHREGNVGNLNLLYTDKLSTQRMFNRLSGISNENTYVTRGAKETAIYKRASNSVVLIVTNEGIGSGVLISNDGKIITNQHVVGNYSEVGVIFKPHKEGANISEKDLRRAKVLKIDEIADLALIKVSLVPQGIGPLSLGKMNEVQVGADVHAIGHPTGEAWTYTKGIISQIRRDYKWATDKDSQHQADVIQTQTPINPGNSGGPLIGDSGLVIGINSFKAEGEALNFAVAVDEIQRFLARDKNRTAPTKKIQEPDKSSLDSCQGSILGQQRNDTNDTTLIFYDANCDNKTDAVMEIPDDVKKPILLKVDSNGDGRVDKIIIDNDRDGRWDVSLHDTDYDGNWDLIGYHPDGELLPSRFEVYSSK